METPDSVREFWFGSSPDDAVVAKAQAKLWWSKAVDVDAGIRRRFAGHLAMAERGELEHWSTTLAGRLALILLTDQFPRNIYRDTPRAFAFDQLARAWCTSGIENGVHKSLRPIERVFFYLPLEHSESLADQERSLLLYEELLAEAAPEHKTGVAGFLDFARRHREIIARFGRFPHRNRILGRASTTEELAFLKEPGSSF